MKKEIADKWVAALRSGKYAKGRGCLKKEEQYCCLGVLCDISQVARWEQGSPDSEDGRDAYYDGATTHLPRSVMAWSGMITYGGTLTTVVEKKDRRFQHLTDLNDSRDCSFAEIADIIEKQWEEL